MNTLTEHITCTILIIFSVDGLTVKDSTSPRVFLFESCTFQQ